MAAPLRTCTKEEQWSVIHFLISEGVKPDTNRSKEWCHSSSPKPKEFWMQPSAGAITLSLFWDE
jgi:hypothetical protein